MIGFLSPCRFLIHCDLETSGVLSEATVKTIVGAVMLRENIPAKAARRGCD
jgi:hypothetical protein